MWILFSIGACLVIAFLFSYVMGLRNPKPIPQFDPEAPTIEPATHQESLQVAPFTLRPDWSQEQEWVRFITQDEDGNICRHAQEPCHAFSQSWGGWWNSDGATERGPGFGLTGPANPNWKQAIEQRPVKVVNVLQHYQQRYKAKRRAQELAASFQEPERDSCDLVSREELARLRAIETAGRRYVRNYRSQANFERFADALGESL